ncbi:MAG: YheC/YheD family protein [Syntrophomonadaceae bacterium]|nr:YheC/YheD family protein [Syntrophomonadaceae bacterium]
MSNYIPGQKPDQIIQPGPAACTLGVLVSARREPKGFISAQLNTILKEKFAAAHKYGIQMFVFGSDDVSWDNHTIKGSVYKIGRDKSGYWIQRSFSFPDVVYNRIHNRKFESNPRIKDLLKKLESSPDIQLFNSRYLDKWEVYQSLHQDPETSALVPLTSLLTYSSLAQVLSQSGQVFIKPRNNNAARGILKVIRQSPGAYIYSQANSTLWKKCGSLKSLWKQINRIIKKPGDYMVQTGIELCQINGQVLDFRAQIQKNGGGEWVFTGMEARVARKSHFVTTGVNYGRRISFNKAIQATANGRVNYRQIVDSQLNYIFAEVPQCLERNLGLSLAVLSIDIGLDKNGRLWIIEVSSKPEPFVKRDIRKLHYQYLMEYVLYANR